jgi:tetratricopeptide (TPR) repeat protein
VRCTRYTTTPLLPLLKVLPLAPTSNAAPSRRGSSRGRRQGLPIDVAALRLVENLEQESRREPVLVTVDDFQWADPDSYRALHLLARAARRCRLLVIVCVREDIADAWKASDPRAEELKDGRRAGVIEALELGPLSPGDGLELARAVLGSGSNSAQDRSALGTLVLRCGGNPYFIIETILCAVENRELVHGRQGWRLTPGHRGSGLDGEKRFAIPGQVRHDLLDRLRRISTSDRRFLAIAARIGVEFDLRVLAEVSEMNFARLARRFQRLAETKWPVREAKELAGQFEFDHALLRDVLADPSGFPVPAGTLNRLAQWFVRNRRDEFSLQIRLFLEGGQRDRALERMLDGLEESVRSRATRQTLAFLDLMADEFGHTPLVIRSHVNAGAASRENLDLETCAAIANRTLDLRPPLPVRCLVELWRIEAGYRKGKLDSGQEMESLSTQIASLPSGRERNRLEAGLDYLRAYRNLVDWGSGTELPSVWATLQDLKQVELHYEYLRLSQYAAPIAGLLRDFRTAGRILREGMRLADQWGVSESPAGLSLKLAAANVSRIGGDTRAALTAFRRVVSRARAAQIPFLEVVALANLGVLEAECGRWDAGRADMVAALKNSSRMGIAMLAGQTATSLCLCELRTGNLPRAEGLLREIEATSEFSSSVHGAFQVQLIRALMMADAGEPARARRLIRECEVAYPGAIVSNRDMVFRCLARVDYRAHRYAAARTHLVSALNAAERLGDAESVLGALQELRALSTLRHRSSERARWNRRLSSVARRHDLDGGLPRGGLGVPVDSPAGAARPLDEEGRGYPVISGVGSVRERLLTFLCRKNGGDNASTFRTTLAPVETETSIQRGIGLPRAKFARALRRLESSGLVQRARFRGPTDKRIIYHYSVTASGRAQAQLLGESRDI